VVETGVRSAGVRLAGEVRVPVPRRGVAGGGTFLGAPDGFAERLPRLSSEGLVPEPEPCPVPGGATWLVGRSRAPGRAGCAGGVGGTDVRFGEHASALRVMAEGSLPRPPAASARRGGRHTYGGSEHDDAGSVFERPPAGYGSASGGERGGNARVA
jgi:hypothetical protein